MSRECTANDALVDVRQPLLAGWLSLVLHLILLLAGALLFRAVPRMALEEVERPVNIVLAATTAASADTSYFDDPPTGGEFEASIAGVSGDESSGGPASGSSSGLPDAASGPSSTGQIALPGTLAPVGSGIELPIANASGGKRGTAVIDPTAGMAEILAAEAARPRATGPVGQQGEVSVFGTAAARGHSFVFLIDRSHSMGSGGLGAIAAAEAELLAALEKLESNHQFQIVAYNQSPTSTLR